jgi:hypothetical protein
VTWIGATVLHRYQRRFKSALCKTAVMQIEAFFCLAKGRTIRTGDRKPSSSFFTHL